MKRTFTFLFAALLACVSMVKADVTDLPQITTDLENPIYYTIYNTRSSQPGGLMYYAGDAVGLKDGCSSFGDKYKFFFTGSHDALYIHNAATTNKLAGVDSWTAEGTEWAVGVSPKGTGLAIGPKGGLDSNGCINEKNYDTGADQSDFTTWSANDDGSVFVMELAEGYVSPMTDLLYVIECPLFEKVQGVKKALYVNAVGTAAWATEDLTNLNYYWAPTVNEDGTVALKNLGTNEYLSNTDGAMSADAVYATINAIGAKSFNIKFNGNVLHANGHDNGKAANGGLTNWGGNAGSASAWRFVQKNDPTKLQEAVVTYNLTYGDEVKYTQTVTTLVGEEWPAITVALPYKVSATKPEGVIAEEDLTEGAVTKEIALTVAELPFEVGAWYYVKMHSNLPRYIEENENGTIDWEKQSLVTPAESLLWGFEGDIWNGFKLVNKGSGKAVNAINSTTGEAEMGDATNATAFVFSPSAAKADAFCLKYPTGNYLNAQSGKVKSWSGNDAGSTFLLEVYSEDLFDLSEVVVGDWEDVTNDETIVNPDLSSLEAWGTTIWNATNNTNYDAENGVMEFVAGENTSASLVQESAPFAKGVYRLTGKAYHKGAVNAVMFVGDKTVEIPAAEELTEISIEFEVEGGTNYGGWTEPEYLNVGYSCEFDNAEDVLVVGGFKLEAKSSMTLQNKFSVVAEKLGGAQWELESTFAALYEANKTTFDAAYASALEISSALQNGKKVFKSAVKSSIQAMEAELAADYMKVLSYYSGEFNTVQSEAENMLWSVEGTEAHATLQAAIPTSEAIATVTEVAQLEEMVAAMEAAMETAREYIPAEVVLEHDAVIEIKVGETFQLVAKVLPATASQAINWWKGSDWNDEIITVTETGLVTALAEGEVTITVESAADNWVYTECTVKVVGLTDDIENIETETETVIYDLSGRRVEKMEKGIYIVNGKKVVVK